ncbi:hypothetical protein DAEQUDRAFT_769204 [Daedalea quercina L-15889]|uniref:Uncharacterized protein n=1 Tax=Daedalea quercina L-15889 TaxID=1314783 RepID=A0A165LZQ0_9APHY|nr:hypothetical protein DAEQUDRAFT_769204 [Daedalea quercina L-15889]
MAFLRDAMDQALTEIARDAAVEDCVTKDDTSSSAKSPLHGTPGTPLHPLSDMIPQQPSTPSRPRLWKWLGLILSHAEPDFPIDLPTSHGHQCLQPEPPSLPQTSTVAKPSHE